jgi:uncharacterized membrane protein
MQNGRLIPWPVSGCRALFALFLLAASVHAQDTTATQKLDSVKNVYMPATTNDFGGMIFSLLQQQTQFLSQKQGADVGPSSLGCD